VAGGSAGSSYWPDGAVSFIAEIVVSYLSLDGDGDILTGVLDGVDEDKASGTTWAVLLGFRVTP
jgi:hypothetical protein